MKLALLLGAVAFLGGLPWVLRALRAQEDPVSPYWLVENERRAWTDGVDGVAWKWPKAEESDAWHLTMRRRAWQNMKAQAEKPRKRA